MRSRVWDRSGSLSFPLCLHYGEFCKDSGLLWRVAGRGPKSGHLQLRIPKRVRKRCTGSGIQSSGWGVRRGREVSLAHSGGPACQEIPWVGQAWLGRIFVRPKRSESLKSDLPRWILDAKFPAWGHTKRGRWIRSHSSMHLHPKSGESYLPTPEKRRTLRSG